LEPRTHQRKLKYVSINTKGQQKRQRQMGRSGKEKQREKGRESKGRKRSNV